MSIFGRFRKGKEGAELTSVMLALSETTSGNDSGEREGTKNDRFFIDREGNVSVFEASTIRNDIVAKGDLWIGKDAVIDGRIQVEGDLIMEKNSRVTGSAYVRGSANFKENSMIMGDVNILGQVYRGNNPPEHMFRNRRRKSPVHPSGPGGDVSDVVSEVDKIINSDTLQPGSLMIIQEKKTDLSYAIIRKFSEAGIPCMIIGREPPERIRSVRMIEIDDEQVLWLTTLVGRRCVNPTHLGSIQNSISRFIDVNSSGYILIDGVEYLISNNGFDAVLKFINRIEDMVITTGTAVIVSIDPRTLDSQHLALLERGAETIYREDSERAETDLGEDIDERLKEESVRRQQLEDRLDSYLARIESTIAGLRSGSSAGIQGGNVGIKDLEIARNVIQEEIGRLEENFRKREIELLEILENRLGRNSGDDNERMRMAEMEEQLKDNSELLLKAVLLAEKLSVERGGSEVGKEG